MKRNNQQFWIAANSRFLELEHELDLHNFSFILLGFVQTKALDELAFIQFANKAILRNLARIDWKDFSMILNVAEKLHYDKLAGHPEMVKF